MTTVNKSTLRAQTLDAVRDGQLTSAELDGLYAAIAGDAS